MARRQADATLLTTKRVRWGTAAIGSVIAIASAAGFLGGVISGWVG